MSFTAAQVAKIMAFMVAAEGKHYSEDLSLRLGPTDYDCSGLVYAASHAAGINIPSDDSIANLEANWFGSNGAQVIKSASQVQTGDIIFFQGAAPGPSNYGPIGHVGIVISPGKELSAYDTASGVSIQPISQDIFVVAMRLNGSAQPSPTSNPGSGGTGISWPAQITNMFGDADAFVSKLAWLVNPASWVRIVAFLAGCALLLFAIHALIAAGKGEPLVGMPSTIPLPVPV
jgi:hypothetical protein